MTLLLRHLSLRAETGRGRYGADIPLSPGLCVIRADNSRGKSTAVQSVLFALGLERMITAQPENAVTSAMRDRLIFDQTTKEETPVLSSSVSLEFANAAGDIVTATRWVKHDTIETGLVQLQRGPQLTSPGDYPVENYYTGRGGSAANPRGFHRWLAAFIDWTLPEFQASDGRVVPLYMEQVFPLLFVEQRRGWGGIQAQMPYFAGVAEVRSRAIEFLLDLDVGRLEGQRQQLRAREDELVRAWRSSMETFKTALEGEGLSPIRLPEKLTVSWPPSPPPYVASSSGTTWIPLDELLANIRAEMRSIDTDALPSVEAAAGDLENDLSSLLEESDRLREVGAAQREGLIRDREELDAVHRRVAALKEDLREHQDVVTLTRLGAPELAALHADCPVCHRPLPPSLMGDPAVPALSPEDTVAYIRQQIDLFEVMARDGQRSFDAKREQWSALQQRDADVRAQIRTIRTSLQGPNNAPSADLIARRVRLEDRIDRLQRISESFLEVLARLDRLAEEGRQVRAALAALPKERLSETDAQKLAALERSFIEQLHEYDFGSFSDERLMVSRDNYHPRRDDFDLQADISASDSIRVVWAYLLGLLEVAQAFPTNHPRFLVFDEPRQQSAKSVSFNALLNRASKDASASQVIFATSEELTALEPMLQGVASSLHRVDGYLLKPVAE